MNQQLVKALLLEVDANLDKLRAQLRTGEKDVTGFAGKVKATNKDTAASAELMGNKFAGAARGAASAIETIARTGKASGEAMKQLIAQGSQAALFFGPQGAFLGAIGITTLAVVGMFSRTREELAELERRTTETLNRFAELDAAGQQRAIARLVAGDPFKQGLDTIFATSDADARRAGIRGRGRLTIGEDLARLRTERAALAPRLRMSQTGSGASMTADVLRERELTEQIDELTRAYREMGHELELMVPRAQASSQQEAALKAVTEGNKVATKEATEAERERAAGLKQLASESERVAERAQRLIAKTLSTSSARVAAEFDAEISAAMQLATDGVDASGNLALVDQLTAARDQAVAAAAQLERFAQAFVVLERASAEGLQPTISDFWMIDTVIAGAEEHLLGLTEGTEDYTKLQAEVNRLLAKRKELLKGVADAGDGAEGSKSTTRDMADYAREVQQAADGALQLAQNLGGASGHAVTMLRAIAQVAGNLPALAKAIESGGARSIVAAALPVLGALSSLFGSSPAQQQAAAELRENTKAIREWTARVGLLGGLDVAGSDVAGLSGRLSAFARRTPGMAPARSAAAAAGLDLAALDKLAAAYGITLNENVESFRQLARAIDDTIGKLGEFGTDLESQRRQAEAEIALFGIADPAERLRIRQGALRGRSTALDGVTAGLDLTTAEGRAQARRNAQALFEVMRAGGATLGADALGGLTGDELLQALLDLVESLRELDDAVAEAGTGSVVGGVSGYSGLTAAAGARLEDYNRTLVFQGQEAAAARAAMLARLDVLVQRAGGAIPVPPLGAASALGASGAAMHVAIGAGAIVVQVEAAGATRDDVLSAIGTGLERAAGDALFRGLVRAKQAAGDLRVVRG